MFKEGKEGKFGCRLVLLQLSCPCRQVKLCNPSLPFPRRQGTKQSSLRGLSLAHPTVLPRDPDTHVQLSGLIAMQKVGPMCPSPTT
eukprot:1158966-Pelagomonas_calceolata.AAC.7